MAPGYVPSALPEAMFGQRKGQEYLSSPRYEVVQQDPVSGREPHATQCPNTVQDDTNMAVRTMEDSDSAM
jgi:hypothetical protein